MKWTRGVRLKWITITAALVLLLKNIMLTGNLTHRKSALYFSNVRQNSSGSLNSSDDISVTVKRISDGYSLADRVNKRCNRTVPLRQIERVFTSYKWGDVETCGIWKVGTTIIKRIYMMKNLPKYRRLINPYDISFDIAYHGKPSISNSKSTTRFMFVRDPYSRLFSGYVDKVLAPNPVYWHLLGIPGIRVSRPNPDKLSLKCGHDLQFHEYIKLVIKALQPKPQKGKGKEKADGHFDRMTSLCKPCQVNYSFIGKMESFAQDSLELLRRLNVSDKTVELIDVEGGKLAWMDALKDTAHQPFYTPFKREFIKCISQFEAVKRAWNKMQLRGIIGRQELPLTETDIDSLTEAQFIDMAIKARENSTSEERKQLHKEQFIKMFSLVPKSDLELIRTIYANDFKLFEYNDRPDILFGNRSSVT